ncbi:hypothetical protein NDU88_005762 [Pleurodeles waltl]|uniref:Uncharacterized protein n=1 Tax=Pleurodeles waltl TaxID=8319 RepID=A0AAV7WCV1_PLEWA|nr:hypothetical protein NDU88_005762 [Pleurodeles waltl]
MGKPRGKQGDPQMETVGMAHSMQALYGKKEPMAPTIQVEFDRILVAITDTKAALQQDIGVVSPGLGLLRAEHRKLVEKVM